MPTTSTIITLYDPSVDANLSALSFLEYAQIPIAPFYPLPPSLNAEDVFLPIPVLLDSGTEDANGITIDTDGSVFDNIPGYDPLTYLLSNGQVLTPTGRFFSASENTGYAGFTNYTIDFGAIDLSDIEGSLVLQTVNPEFPILDPLSGFTLSFDLTLLEEVNSGPRAGFSILVVTNDPTQEIELGFDRTGGDRVFAQLANFTEGEDTTGIPLDLSQKTTFALTVTQGNYVLTANGTTVLSGALRDYDFDPSTSDPPFPPQADPYSIPNLIFFGDNTDSAHAQFTLGKIEVTTFQATQSSSSFFDYEQYLRFQSPNAIAPTDEINGLPLVQLFDENAYLNQYNDVAAAIRSGAISSGYAHFVDFGIGEGRNPSILYDEAYYLSLYGDVVQAIADGAIRSGLEHFLLYGHLEGRDPSAFFHQADYLSNYGDVANAVNTGSIGSAFEHYIEFGVDENRLPNLSLFNEAFYLQNHADVATAIANHVLTDGFEHFVLYGQQEGRAPSRLFNEFSYRSLHPDVDAAVIAGTLSSGFAHYEQYGRFENRPVFT
jgi:hypothetical protein